MNRAAYIIMRHRSAFSEGTALIAFIGAAAALAFVFDFSGRSADPRIDLNELLLLGILLGAALAWFGWRRILEQEAEIKSKTEAEQRAEYLAHHDHLTGLPNRRRLQQEFNAPSKIGVRALLLLDLNGFKRINDVFGHASGDAVLKIVAQRLTDVLNGNALVARMGGDEFAVVLRDEGEADKVANLANEIIASLHAPIIVGADAHFIGTGIGIALVSSQTTEVAEVMRKADVALYRTKAQTGSSFAFYDEAMDREEREKDFIRRELAAAVAANVIVPFYQPIVDLETGAIRAFEALARWTHPTLGARSPEHFIPLAEESGLIRQLSDAILKRACEDAMNWPSHVGLCFNVSSVMLRDQTLGLRILSILGKSGLSASRLELEIAETAITRDLEIARGNLTQLRNAGLRIVLDDFGTGATSLAHLRSFRFDGIKIDRRFVELMLNGGESAAIVRAIIGLAKGLGLDVVAEGVEQKAQSKALQKEGCTVGQGFFFGHAIPATEIDRIFAQSALHISQG